MVVSSRVSEESRNKDFVACDGRDQVVPESRSQYELVECLGYV